ncbi:MAG TPA: hypothetical protein VKM35_03515 [Arenimonas sp.]|nr:hypothetical protein [Arenimonas sp.]
MKTAAFAAVFFLPREPRSHGCDGMYGMLAPRTQRTVPFFLVIPAKAGIQRLSLSPGLEKSEDAGFPPSRE